MLTCLYTLIGNFKPMEEYYDDYKRSTHLPDDFTVQNRESFSPDVWGPHYWFFLHTIAHCYPEHPNEVTKRKYYDLIQNMPLFIPNESIGNDFSKMLDNYPLTPYLENRDSFIRWMHFIHNRVNLLLDKECPTLFEGLDKYRSHYTPPTLQLLETFRIQKEYVLGFFIVISILFIFLVQYNFL